MRAEISQKPLGLRTRDNFAQIGGCRRADSGHAAETREKLARAGGADARDVFEFGVQRAFRAALSVEADGEAMGFVADLLHQMQDRRVVIEAHGLVLLSQDVENFFLLGDGRDGLIDDGEFVERGRSGVQLAEAAVDEDEAG